MGVSRQAAKSAKKEPSKEVDDLARRVISYLRALGKQLGLLINFQQAILADGVKRVVLT